MVFVTVGRDTGGEEVATQDTGQLRTRCLRIGEGCESSSCIARARGMRLVQEVTACLPSHFNEFIIEVIPRVRGAVWAGEHTETRAYTRCLASACAIDALNALENIKCGRRRQLKVRAAGHPE